jgi:hypothetical protein
MEMMFILRELTNNIKYFLEQNEDIKLHNHSKKSNEVDLAPLCDSGNPKTDESSRPTLIFRLDEEKNIFILSWIYLKTTKKGLGTELIQRMISYCQVNKIDQFYIKNIESSNFVMIKFVKKFGFEFYGDYDGDLINCSLRLE